MRIKKGKERGWHVEIGRAEGLRVEQPFTGGF